MKIRICFITNSSSSSFIINKNILTLNQYNIILNKCKTYEEAKKLNMSQLDKIYNWHISINQNDIIGYTTTDDFKYIDFLKKIGVDLNQIQYDISLEQGLSIVDKYLLNQYKPI